MPLSIAAYASSTATVTKENQAQGQSLWESFCNEVLCPVIEDAAYSYLDNNYGTNFTETKQQREKEEAYYEVLIQEEEAQNQTIGEAINNLLAKCGADATREYLDSNLGTNLVERSQLQKEENTKLLEEAHEFQSQQETGTPKPSLFSKLLSLLLK